MTGRGGALVQRCTAALLALAFALALVPGAQGAATGSRATRARRAVVTVMAVGYETRLATAINDTRRRYGLARLRLAPELMRAAANHSLQMASKGFFSHYSASGASFRERVKSWFGTGTYSNVAAGEDLFWARSRIAPSKIVSCWLASPPHRAVLLSPRWRALGVGVVHVSRSPGVFRDQDVLVVTADFAGKR
jgi:uncharacterized protein YkwD